MNGLWLAGGLPILLAGPLRQPMESSMALHMLVQLPLLVWSGALLWPLLQESLCKPLERWDRGGIAALLWALLTVLFWMLPRNLDAAVSEPAMDALKFVSLTLTGLALRWSWPRLSVVLRGVVWSQLVAMLMVMGWLYLTAPVRVCNSYGADQQTVAGYAFVAASLLLALFLTARVFVSGPAAPD